MNCICGELYFYVMMMYGEEKYMSAETKQAMANVDLIEVPAWMGRTEVLLGADDMQKLLHAHVLVVGLGGVGSFAAEAIARSGVGMMTIVDGDVVDPTNGNRQLPALHSTHGLWKADVVAQRLMDINPSLRLTVIKEFLKESAASALLDGRYDFVVDCIDTLAPKVNLIRKAVERGLPVVSSLGAAGRIDPMKIRIADICHSHQCQLAFYVRKRLRKFGIETGVTVVYSHEETDKSTIRLTEGLENKRSFMGTISYIPAIFGLMSASVVIRGIVGRKSMVERGSVVEPLSNKQKKKKRITVKADSAVRSSVYSEKDDDSTVA